MKKKLNFLVVAVQSYLQWTLKTIQIKLIHALGGYTKEEYRIPSLNTHNKAFDNGFKQGCEFGYKYLAKQLHNIAISIYPCSKQEWIDAVWNKIDDVYKNDTK